MSTPLLRRMLLLGICCLLSMPLWAAGDFPLPSFPPEVIAYPAGEVVALQPLATLLGCTAKRDLLTGEVTVARQGNTFTCAPHTLAAVVNGTPGKLTLMPMQRGNTCYVPLRPLIAALKGTVGEGNTGLLTLTLPGWAQPMALPVKTMTGEAASLRETNSELYVMNIDGTGLRRLTYGLGSRSVPSFSADGATWVEGIGGNIYLHQAANQMPVCLLQTKEDEGKEYSIANLHLSPDGKSAEYQALAFSTESRPFRRTIQADWYSINMDGTGKHPIYRAGEECVSPDGTRRLQVHGNAPLTVHIEAGPDAGKTITDPSGTKRQLASGASFSADGKFIVFYDYAAGLCIADAELTNVRTIIPKQATGFTRLQFTPDSMSILCNQEYNQYGLYLVNCDGSGMRLLTPGMHVAEFSILPDGKRILFTARSN